MRYLNDLPAPIKKDQAAVVALRGLNWTDNFEDGEMEECFRLSSRRFPYIATCKLRRKYQDTESINGVLDRMDDTEDLSINVLGAGVWNSPFYIYDERTSVETVGALKKIRFYDRVSGWKTENLPGSAYMGRARLAPIQNRIAIWPAKQMLNFKTGEIEPCALSCTLGNTSTSVTGTCSAAGEMVQKSAGTKEWEPTGNDGNMLRIDKGASAGWDKLYQGMELVLNVFKGSTNLSIDSEPYVIEKIVHGADGKFLYVTMNKNMHAARVITGTISTRVPDMEYICSHENRIFGCSSMDQTIYISKQGQPVFFDFSGNYDDSFALEVSSEGGFTGCGSLPDSVVFFKSGCLHKITGSLVTDFSLQTLSCDGCASHDSIVMIHDVMFFMGKKGVYYYDGTRPVSISDALGAEKTWSDGVAGTDGENYYLSCKVDGKRMNLVYDTKYGIWLQRDDFITDFFLNISGRLYEIGRKPEDENDREKNRMYLSEKDEMSSAFGWHVTFKPTYEKTTGRYGSKTLVNQRKKYRNIRMRVELPEGSQFHVLVRTDDGPWKIIKRVAGNKQGIMDVKLPISRCDKYQLQLKGNGQFTLIDLIKEFGSGSVKE